MELGEGIEFEAKELGPQMQKTEDARLRKTKPQREKLFLKKRRIAREKIGRRETLLEKKKRLRATQETDELKGRKENCCNWGSHSTNTKIYTRN